MTQQTLPRDVVDLVESGVSILIGTRDAELRPATVRGVGAVVSADRGHVTVFFPVHTGERAKRNLDDNGQIAVGFSRPLDHLSVQLKGECSQVSAGSDAQREIVERYRHGYIESTYMVGLPRALMKRIVVWPAWSASFGVRDIFLQTPGPEAGRRLGAP